MHRKVNELNIIIFYGIRPMIKNTDKKYNARTCTHRILFICSNINTPIYKVWSKISQVYGVMTKISL